MDSMSVPVLGPYLPLFTIHGLKLTNTINKSWFGLLGLNASVTARVISRFGLLGLNISVTTRVISRFGLLGLNASVTARSY